MAEEKTLTSSLAIDPEFAEFLKTIPDKSKTPAPTDISEFRKTNDANLRMLFWEQLQSSPATQRTVYQVPTLDGTTTIPVTRFVAEAEAAATSSAPKPAWLYLHGGGMTSGSVDIYAPQMAWLAAASGVAVFGVGYRLAPEHPAPAAVEDCYAALAWASAHAGELGLDAARLGVMGDSAGGGLAAGVALLARDRALRPRLARQLLVYPMLDDRTMARLESAPPGHRLRAAAALGLDAIPMCWHAYLGDGHADADVSPYVAPGRAADVTGLPPAYIDIGNLDLFRDEVAAYAARLLETDIDVEFHVYSGVPHGFEIAWGIGVTKRALQNRIAAMKRL